ALEALKSAELLFCEDTRVTKRLLKLLSSKYNLTFTCDTFQSFHHHNEQKVLKNLDKNILLEKNVVYVSDAGMPCVSDPGSTLVEYCIQNEIPYDVIPGANAVLTAFAMSGFDATEFSFFGFLPHKGKERHEKLLKVLNSEFLPILYESPHRLLKLLEELTKIEPSRMVFLAKELTKLHQKTFKKTALDLYEELKTSSIKGEWVVVLQNKEISGSTLELSDISDLDLPPKQKAKLISKLTGRKTKEVYQEILDKI
ncbi:MAG: 16S rRNA (cytidine(1402)-2'-O)-methyltransferase, partial [Campylobacteraceae bacterium]|nr:16S rRNA (cytidine(1402)-2'-O)-methyltransferase [Campylobacteraceae bacterium]